MNKITLKLGHYSILGSDGRSIVSHFSKNFFLLPLTTMKTRAQLAEMMLEKTDNIEKDIMKSEATTIEKKPSPLTPHISPHYPNISTHTQDKMLKCGSKIRKLTTN